MGLVITKSNKRCGMTKCHLGSLYMRIMSLWLKCAVGGSKKEGGDRIKDKIGGSGSAVMEMSGGHWW